MKTRDLLIEKLFSTFNVFCKFPNNESAITGGFISSLISASLDLNKSNGQKLDVIPIPFNFRDEQITGLDFCILLPINDLEVNIYSFQAKKYKENVNIEQLAFAGASKATDSDILEAQDNLKQSYDKSVSFEETLLSPKHRNYQLGRILNLLKCEKTKKVFFGYVFWSNGSTSNLGHLVTSAKFTADSIFKNSSGQNKIEQNICLNIDKNYFSLNKKKNFDERICGIEEVLSFNNGIKSFDSFSAIESIKILQANDYLFYAIDDGSEVIKTIIDKLKFDYVESECETMFNKSEVNIPDENSMSKEEFNTLIHAIVKKNISVRAKEIPNDISKDTFFSLREDIYKNFFEKISNHTKKLTNKPSI